MTSYIWPKHISLTLFINLFQEWCLHPSHSMGHHWLTYTFLWSEHPRTLTLTHTQLWILNLNWPQESRTWDLRPVLTTWDMTHGEYVLGSDIRTWIFPNRSKQNFSYDLPVCLSSSIYWISFTGCHIHKNTLYCILCINYECNNNKKYYVLRNSGWARSWYTLKLSHIF